MCFPCIFSAIFLVSPVPVVTLYKGQRVIVNDQGYKTHIICHRPRGRNLHLILLLPVGH